MRQSNLMCFNLTCPPPLSSSSQLWFNLEIMDLDIYDVLTIDTGGLYFYRWFSTSMNL